MRRWLLLAAVLLLIGAALWLLWWPPGAPANRTSDLGTALAGGGVIALVVLLLERQFAAEADRRNLLLTLGLGQRFVGIDLRGRDLSRAYLVDKNFSGARLGGTNLKGADLAGADLSRADLRGADLRGTNFRGTPPPLVPSPNLTPSPSLTPSSGVAPAGAQQLGDTTLQNVDVREATYDDSTRWPEGFDPADEGAVHVKYPSWWRRMFGG